MASIYQINKGINKPIEFKGLKAQYISYLAIGLVVLLILFASLYIIGVNLLLCIGIVVVCGTILFVKVYALSYKYGEYGLLKKAAKRYIPNFIKLKSRKIFLNLNSIDQHQKERSGNGKRN